jgi:hypothetical protein
MRGGAIDGGSMGDGGSGDRPDGCDGIGGGGILGRAIGAFGAGIGGRCIGWGGSDGGGIDGGGSGRGDTWANAPDALTAAARKTAMPALRRQPPYRTCFMHPTPDESACIGGHAITMSGTPQRDRAADARLGTQVNGRFGLILC